MNLHSIVSGAISVVNPPQSISVRVSTGNTVNADGSVSPSYAAPVKVTANVTALAYNDIIQADSLNIQGVRRKIYINGDIDGLVRAENKGGDLITLPDGTIWLVAMITEHWDSWTSAIITLQNNS